MSNSENPRSLRENCIHVTNFAVNKENVAKFVHNESPNECVGNKVGMVVHTGSFGGVCFL